MKKIIALLISLAICLSIVSCGSSVSTDDSGGQQSTEDSVSAETEETDTTSDFVDDTAGLNDEESISSENSDNTEFDYETVEALLQGNWISYDSDSVFSLWVFNDGSYTVNTYVDGKEAGEATEGTYTIESDAIYTATTNQSNVAEGSIPYHIEDGALILDPVSGVSVEKVESDDVFANFIFVVESVSGTLSYTYSDYVYDSAIDQIVSYTVSGDENGKYVLTYDDNGLLISESLENKNEKYGTETHTYTYYEDGTLKSEVESYTTENAREGTTFEYTHELNESGQITKTTTVNVTSDNNYTMVYEYEYDDSGKVIREKQTSPNSTYIIDYTYDENGNISTKTSYKEDEPSKKSQTVYEYMLLRKDD